MSLAQLELGSNDPYTDLVDRSAVDGLDRLTNGEGWFVPYVDGERDSLIQQKTGIKFLSLIYTRECYNLE